MTVGELAERIYGIDRGNPEYRSYYMKVFRAVKALQSRGYVSTSFFGRDRPYKLTPYAAARLMEIETDDKVLPRLDLTAYLLAVVLGLANLVVVLTVDNWPSGTLVTLLYSALLVLTGYCLARLTAALRRVS